MKIRTTITIDEKKLKDIKIQAIKEDLLLSAIIEKAIDKYLESTKTKETKFEDFKK